ncbi:MAG: glycosyltransferase family 2 protein [Bryobacteraceae bacterium]|nr:glycosyltransferase family 2 protein [Bryobacteraceae bacterium]
MTGIVIVTWNSEEVIGACLDACLPLSAVEIVVIDNASVDRTVELARERKGVKVIANMENRGFAAACNQGFAAVPNSSAILLLNPDAVLESGFHKLGAQVAEPGVGGATGRLVDDVDGQTQRGFGLRRLPTPMALALEVLGLNKLLPWNPVNRRWRMADYNDEVPGFVEQPAGAFLMVRREAWEAVGGLDESFWPAWFEDVDLCLRLRRAGYSIRYIPDAVAKHRGGHSASRLKWADRQLFWYGNLLRYSVKHFAPIGRKLVAGAVMFACVPRTVASMFSGQHLSSARVYSRVFRVACAAWRGSTPRFRVEGPPSREEKRARRF